MVIQPEPDMFQGAIKRYKRVMLRDPISLKMAMSFASIFLGVALIVTPKIPAAVVVMCAWVPAWIWGCVFLVTGSLRLLFIGGNEFFPVKIRGGVSLISMYLWVYLNISSAQSTQFDAMNSLMVVTVVFELWILVHSIFPHRGPRRCTDEY